MFIVQLIIFQALLFAGLALLLKKLMGQHATTATAHLQQLTQEYLKKQEELKKRLGESEKHYQELMNKGEEEVKKLQRQSLEEAEAKNRRMVEEARQESERIVAQAIQARDALRREIEATLEKRTLERACELIQETLPKQLQEAVHHRWVDDLIQNGLLQSAQISSQEEITEAQMASAVALTQAQKEKIQKKLEDRLGHSLILKEIVNPLLIAGFTLTLGHLVLDGSLASKLKEAARRHAPEGE